MTRGKSVKYSLDYDNIYKKIKPLKDADHALVILADDGKIGRLTPHCKIHRAMNKLTPEGIWRCVTTYLYYKDEKGNLRFKENNCKAGCVYK